MVMPGQPCERAFTASSVRFLRALRFTLAMPGEPFVELGLRIKRESPFAWTYPVGYAGDHLGYLVTPEAWEAGGYESLIARSARPSAEGVSHLVDEALDLLGTLYDEGRQR